MKIALPILGLAALLFASGCVEEHYVRTDHHRGSSGYHGSRYRGGSDYDRRDSGYYRGSPGYYRGSSGYYRDSDRYDDGDRRVYSGGRTRSVTVFSSSPDTRRDRRYRSY
jgi:hypothetical protein